MVKSEAIAEPVFPHTPLRQARKAKSQASPPRPGFSLLEVLMAVGLLLASLAILSQLTTIGRQHLDKATSKSIATRLCQNKLARLVAGVDSIRTGDEAPLEEDPTWEYRVDVTPLALGDLAQLSVSVRPAASSSDIERSVDARPWFTLVRWIPDHLTSRQRSGVSTSNRPGYGL